MPSHPVPLSAQADITAVAAKTGFSAEVVERIYHHLGDVDGEPPERSRLQAYTAHVGGGLGEGGLRIHFGLPPDPARPADPLTAQLLERMAAREEDERKQPTDWTKARFQLRYIDACMHTTPPFMPHSIAPHFVTLAGKRGVSPDHLRSLVRRFGVPRKFDWRSTDDRG
jgi:hypothetical protein